MTKYRYDQLAFSSVTANFINVSTPTGVITCSGTIANGSGANFSATVSLPVNNSYNDVFLLNQNTNNKSYLNNNVESIDSIWQYVSSETVQVLLTYTPTSATVEISVSNYTGATITLINQAYTVSAVVYNIPF